MISFQSAAGFEEDQGLLDGGDVVDADDLDALAGEGEGAADGAGGAVGLFVADQLADEGFAGVADEQGAAEVVEAAAVGHKRGVVLVGFAEADAGIEADALAVDAGGGQGVAALAEEGVDLVHDVVVERVVLHRLRIALHVHCANACAAGYGDFDHG